MSYYVPGSQEKDISKVILSLQNLSSSTPVWTGLHTFNSTSGGLYITGSPGYTVSTAINPYFISTSLTSQLIKATAASATSPETGFQSVVTSGVGSAASTTAFKIGVFGSATGASGSADVYGGNFVGQLSSGAPSTSTGIALECDFNANNAHYGDTAGTPTAPYAAPLYVATGGTNRSTAYILVVGGGSAGGANRGLCFQAGTPIRLNTIEDYSTVSGGGFANVAGTYAAYGMDFVSGTFGLGIARYPNNNGLYWRNAANSADISVLKLDTNNDITLGSTASRTVNYSGTASGQAVMQLINSNATAGDVGITFGVGANTAADTTSVYLNFLTPNLGAQAGNVSRADAAGVRHVVYNTASDERLKKSIGKLDDATDRIKQIDVHKYVGANYEGDEHLVGFFAQNLHKAYPWAVTPSDDPDYEKKPWQVDYAAVTPLLVAGLQQSLARIETLEAEMKALKAIPWHG